MSEETKECDFTRAEVGKYAQRDPAQKKTRLTRRKSTTNYAP
jgi:hypothetical protein